MKRKRQCPKCDSVKVGFLAYVPDQLYSVPDTQQIIGETPRKAKWYESSRDAKDQYRTEAYVCTECGYLETYVAAPEAVPFERFPHFRWVNSEDTTGSSR